MAHRRPAVADELERLGIAVEVQGAPLGVLWQQLRLPARLQRGDIDVFWSPLLTLPRRMPIPAVVTLHDLAALHVPETLPWKVRWSLLPFLATTVERADRIVVATTRVQGEVQAAFPASRGNCSVVPHGVDPAFRPADESLRREIRAEFGAPDGYLLAVGTLEPRKNLNFLIKGFDKAQEANPDLHMVLAGRRGWMAQAIFDELERRDLLGKVHITGYVKDRHLPALYRGAAAFIYPSLYEGFGLPPLEAMACGTPVIVSRGSSLPEVVGEAGLYIDPLSVDELAAAIERVNREPELAAELSAKGLEQASLFSWERAARETLDILRDAARV